MGLSSPPGGDPWGLPPWWITDHPYLLRLPAVLRGLGPCSQCGQPLVLHSEVVLSLPESRPRWLARLSRLLGRPGRALFRGTHGP